jgi:pullulanase/glycogen debranching enzyme
MSDDRSILDWAAWTSLKHGIVALRRDWTEQRRPRIVWGEDRLPLRSLRPADPFAFARRSGYHGADGTPVFGLRVAELGNGDREAAGIFLAGPFNDWNPAGSDAWRLQPEQTAKGVWLLLRPDPALFAADRPTAFKFVSGSGAWLEVPYDAPNAVTDDQGFRNHLYDPARLGRHLFTFTTPLPLNLAEGRPLIYEDGDWRESVAIRPGFFLKKLESTLAAGARVVAGDTVFRLFAPRASRVELLLFEHLDAPLPEPLLLLPADGMMWELTVAGDRSGWFYYYRVNGDAAPGFTHYDPQFLLLDPYAAAAVGPRGPGIVIGDATFGRDRAADFTPPPWHDLVILEAHVRDLTARAPLPLGDAERLGFTGLRKWLDAPAGYLDSLGINAVELQPVHIHDGVDPAAYAWGYMPVNYFAPASQYALDPDRASQIGEFQELVAALHRKGLAVILDVVYNHVGEPNYLQFIDKEYYFLLDRHGGHVNHSGCGNTLDADTPMLRRLLRDSLVHWLRAYGVDGFRFDLAELLGRATLAWLEAELKAVKPSVILIAEPWSFRGHIGRELRSTGFASWNDGYRDYVRRYILGEEPAAGLLHYLRASWPDWTRFPAQSVNYLESHDDHCWIDKITENPGNDGTLPTARDRRRSHLAAALLLVSAGIPMLAAGMDFLKSKGGMANTYLRGDLNALPYERLAEFPGTHAYFAAWIRFRRSHAGRLLRLDGFPGEDYFHCATDGAGLLLLLNANGALGGDRLLFAVNAGDQAVELALADVDPHAFTQIADSERFDPAGLHGALLPIRAGRVRLPPLSCGLWRQS